MDRLVLLSLLAAGALLAGCRRTEPAATLPPAPRTAPVAVAATPGPAAPLPSARAPVVPPAPKDGLALAHTDPPGTDHLGRARRLRDDGDATGSLVEARKALSDDPRDADALALVARLGRASGQVTLAAEAYERLARLDETDSDALVQAARMRLAAGASEAAEALARSAVARDDGDVEAWQALGRAQLSAGELPQAIASLEQAYALAPAHGWVLNNLGFAYLRANRDGEALEILERAAEVLPDAAVVQNNLGVARERTGDVEGARAAYARSALLAPRYVKALVNGQRTAMLRTGADAGVDVHEPEDAEPVSDDASAGAGPSH